MERKSYKSLYLAAMKRIKRLERENEATQRLYSDMKEQYDDMARRCQASFGESNLDRQGIGETVRMLG